MPNQYFQNFPQIYYQLGNQPAIGITDLTKRFVIQDIVLRYGTIYYKHFVQDGERPDVIADKYYSDSTLDWIILMTNQIYDPFWQWPLDYQSFKSYIISKYGSIPNSFQTIHHYEQIVQPRQTLSNGTVVPERIVIIDKVAYDGIIEEFARRQVSMYDFENALNEARKQIKVIHERFVPQITKEIENIFN